jgi:F-type H+-transporting ATPase subunit a
MALMLNTRLTLGNYCRQKRLFVNRFVKIILVCAFFAAMFAANLLAQPAAASTLVEISSAPTSPADEAVPSAAPVIGHFLGLPVTNSMVCTWIVAAIILIVVRISTWKNIKEIPSGLQNVLEAMVEGWESLIGDILDKRVTRWVFPFATTFFIFIVISNLMDLVPGVGSIGFFGPDNSFTPIFRPPTTDANLTVAMAGIFLVMSIYWAIRFNGVWGLVKHIFGVKMETSKYLYPLFFLLFFFIGAMELLSVGFARPVALAMRLYGNVFAGESILDMIFHGKSLIFTIILSSGMYFYETFVCVVQAFVFAMLVVAFVGTLCTHNDEEHGH